MHWFVVIELGLHDDVPIIIKQRTLAMKSTLDPATLAALLPVWRIVKLGTNAFVHTFFHATCILEITTRVKPLTFQAMQMTAPKRSALLYCLPTSEKVRTSAMR